VHNLPVAFACPSHAPGSWPVRGTWLPASAGGITNKHSTLTSQLSRGILSGYKSKLPTHKQGRFISIFPFPFHFSYLRNFSYLYHFSLHLHYFLSLQTEKSCNDNRWHQIFKLSRFGLYKIQGIWLVEEWIVSPVEFCCRLLVVHIKHAYNDSLGSCMYSSTRSSEIYNTL
jgi:hypothetical protein